MASFSFRGRDKTGELISGEREANSREALAAAMIEDGIILRKRLQVKPLNQLVSGK